jgi:hypothetical protein
MKSTKNLWVALAAIALGTASCTHEPAVKPTGNTDGKLTVSIKSKAPATRAILDGTLITDPILSTFENNLTGFSVYVFDYTTGTLEKAGSTGTGETSVTLTGLNTAGTKRVFVMANATGLTGSTMPTFSSSVDYATGIAAGNVVLADQLFTDFTALTKGLLMTGEYADPTSHVAGPLTLASGTNNIVIPVERVVSKIQLGDITFGDDIALSELAKFRITGAGIQQAVGSSAINPGTTTTATTPAPTLYGAYTGASVSQTDAVISPVLGTSFTGFSDYLVGLLNALNLNISVGGVSLGSVLDATLLQDLVSALLGGILPVTGLDDTLGEAITGVGTVAEDIIKYTPNGFWYVLPSDYAASPTLLTITGTYDGKTYYYPVEINTPTANPSTVTGDGKGNYVQRNTVYKINLQFNSLIGTDDPDEPGKQASIVATIEPVAWNGPVEQNTTW